MDSYFKSEDGQEMPYWEDDLWTKTDCMGEENSGQWEQVHWLLKTSACPAFWGG